MVKKFVYTMLASAMVLGLTACNDSGAAANDQKATATKTEAPAKIENAAAKDTSGLTFEQKVAVSFGTMVGKNLKGSFDEMKGLDFNLDQKLFQDAFANALAGKNANLSEQEIQDTLQEFGRQMQDKQVAKAKTEAEANLKAGEAFLADNAKKDGVKTTQSGLQYKITEEGKGESPAPEDTVKVQYTGKLIDGKVFDKSEEPVQFTLNGVIPGWTEGLQLMKKGGKATFYIPAKLAYGSNPPTAEIPANAVLVFDVELVDVVKATKPAEKPAQK